MGEEIALGLAAGAQRGRPRPIQEGRGGRGAIAGIELPGQARTGNRAGVVVERDQRIELMGSKRHRHGAGHVGLIDGKVAAEDAERLAQGGLEVVRHATRHRRRSRGPGGIGMADAEGPNPADVLVGCRHDPFVADQGEKPPVCDLHKDAF